MTVILFSKPFSLAFRGGSVLRPSYVLAIDQGTTGSTVLVYDRGGRVVSRAYSEFRQYYPNPGWVEHDPEEIWQVTLAVMKRALRSGRIPSRRLAAR